MVETLDTDDSFRAVVSEGLAEDQPDRASWLFLTRPEDWYEELAVISEVVEEESRESSSASQLRATERRLDATRGSLEQAQNELAEAQSRITDLESDAARSRDTVSGLRAVGDSASERLLEFQSERAKVIKNLKSTELLASQRLETIRELEAAMESLRRSAREQMPAPEPKVTGEVARPGGVETAGSTGPRQVDDQAAPPRSPEPFDRERLADAFADAVAALGQLTSAFEQAAEALFSEVGDDTAADVVSVGGEAGIGSVDSGSGDDLVTGAGEGESRGEVHTRRSPIRLRRGAIEGSPEGIAQILRTPKVVVFVDAYNVAMEAWPTLSKSAQRDSLMKLAGSVAARSGAEFHLVFDGIGDGGRPSVATALPVRIHFSDADTEADDLILAFVGEDPERPVLVVSSDKRVQSGSRRLGANSVSSSQMLNFARGRDF